jgi:hypothetical protein
MMGIVLFAILGAKLHMGAGYWICYGVFTALKLVVALMKELKES